MIYPHTILAATRVLSPDEYCEILERYDVLNAGVRDTNKAALFAVLADAVITQVTVWFDGGGDSGQIESVEAKSGDIAVDLPDATVQVRVAEFGRSEIVVRDMPVPELIEQLCYDYLSATHGGWENNDGAYGEFVFAVAVGTIRLEHNERYTASETYNHQF